MGSTCVKWWSWFSVVFSLSYFLMIIDGATGVYRLYDQLQTITLQYNSSELSYFPSLCEGTASDCAGTWYIASLEGPGFTSDSSDSVARTDGPNSMFGDLLPQLFFRFRGQQLFIQTSPTSNATANVTIVMSPSGIVLQNIISPDTWDLEIPNLNNSEIGSVTITFVPSNTGDTHLDIEDIIIYGTNATADPSLLPSQPLPTTNSPAMLPSATPSSSSSQRSGAIQLLLSSSDNVLHPFTAAFFIALLPLFADIHCI